MHVYELQCSMVVRLESWMQKICRGTKLVWSAGCAMFVYIGDRVMSGLRAELGRRGIICSVQEMVSCAGGWVQLHKQVLITGILWERRIQENMGSSIEDWSQNTGPYERGDREPKYVEHCCSKKDPLSTTESVFQTQSKKWWWWCHMKSNQYVLWSGWHWWCLSY